MSRGLSLKSVGENEWAFSYPKKYELSYDYFMEGLNELNAGSRKFATIRFKKALSIFPQNIDALHHLSIIAEDIEAAIKLNDTAVEIGLSVFPKNFDISKDKLEWIRLENRPFLRAYESKALFLLENNPDEALKHFLQLLIWNPNDNQGVREIVADIYVKGERWADMLSLAKKYPLDIYPSVVYGTALALYQTGDIEQATKKLKSCIESTPRCAKILLEEKPKRPKSDMPGYIQFGGEEHAYEFWETQGQAKAWHDEKVKQWLKENI